MAFNGLAGGLASGIQSGVQLGVLYNRSVQQEKLNDMELKQKGLEVDTAQHDNEDLNAVRDAIRLHMGPESSPAPQMDQGAAIPRAVPDTGIAPADASAPSALVMPSSAPSLNVPGAAPSATPQGADATTAPQSNSPDWSKVLGSYEAGIKTALSRGRIDIAKPLMSEAIQMRTTVRNQLLDSADRAYVASGKTDLSGYEKAYNFFPDGHTVKLTPTGDGSVKASFTLDNGKTSESIVPAADVSLYIQKLRNPDEVHKQEMAWATKQFDAGLEVQKQTQIEHVKGDETRKTNAEKEAGDSFGAIAGGEGNGPVIYNKKTGVVQSGGGIAGGRADTDGLNRKDLATHKNIEDLIAKAPKMATLDPVSGTRTLTQDGLNKTQLGSQIWQFNAGPNGERMTPADAVGIALNGKYDLNNPAIVQQGDKYFAIPAVQYQGKTFFLSGRGSYQDVTDKVRAKQGNAAPQPGGIAPSTQAAPQPAASPSAGIGPAANADQSQPSAGIAAGAKNQSVSALNPRNPAHQRLFASMKARGLVEGDTIEEAQKIETQKQQQVEGQSKSALNRRAQLVQAMINARRAGDLQKAETLSGQLAALNKQQGIAAR